MASRRQRLMLLLAVGLAFSVVYPQEEPTTTQEPRETADGGQHGLWLRERDAAIRFGANDEPVRLELDAATGALRTTASDLEVGGVRVRTALQQANNSVSDLASKIKDLNKRFDEWNPPPFPGPTPAPGCFKLYTTTGTHHLLPLFDPPVNENCENLPGVCHCASQQYTPCTTGDWVRVHRNDIGRWNVVFDGPGPGMEDYLASIYLAKNTTAARGQAEAVLDSQWTYYTRAQLYDGQGQAQTEINANGVSGAWVEYDYSVSIMIGSGEPPPGMGNGGGSGIVFRVRNADNFIAVLLYPPSTGAPAIAQLIKTEAGVPSIVAEAGPGSYYMNNPIEWTADLSWSGRRLSVRVTAARYDVYWDDELLFGVEDPQPLPTHVGFLTWGTWLSPIRFFLPRVVSPEYNPLWSFWVECGGACTDGPGPPRGCHQGLVNLPGGGLSRDCVCDPEAKDGCRDLFSFPLSMSPEFYDCDSRDCDSKCVPIQPTPSTESITYWRRCHCPTAGGGTIPPRTTDISEPGSTNRELCELNTRTNTCEGTCRVGYECEFTSRSECGCKSRPGWIKPPQ